MTLLEICRPLMAILLLLPLTTAVLLGGSMLAGVALREKTVGRVTAMVMITEVLCAAVVGGTLMVTGGGPLTVSMGDWFHTGSFQLDLSLHGDALSAPLVVLVAVLAAIIGRFSVPYLHREPGFHRFFLLLHLFLAGMMLIVIGGSLELLFVGWEMVGLASVLLIAFYEGRAAPVNNGLWTLACYRISDVGLIVAILALHHTAHSTRWLDLFSGQWPAATTTLPESTVEVVVCAALLAALCKSAQLPFSGWLTRAMEGPTPSSALFYGALSIHAGAILALRMSPFIERTPGVGITLAAVGGLTAIHATMVGRAQPDAKSSTAHAAMCQVGLIFVEIGMGWYDLALFHLIGHACLRTLDFLRAPSMLHDHQLVASAIGGTPRRGKHLERLLPFAVQRWLYRLALFGGHLDELLVRYGVDPLLFLLRELDGLEQRWMDRTRGERRK